MREITIGPSTYKIHPGTKVRWIKEGEYIRCTFDDVSVLLKDVGACYYVVIQ